MSIIPTLFEGIKKKWDFSKIDAKSILTLSNELKVDVQEYAKNHIAQEENIKEIEQFLTKKLQEEAVKLFEVLQEAKSNPLGIGRRVRAFHTKVWKKGD